MKVSLDWAQHQSNVNLQPNGKEALLEKIGSQLGAIEEVIEWAPRFDGIVVVKVVSCEPHDNADKLHVCKVDDGGKTVGVQRDERGFVQVVCGAPNVAQDMLAVWIPPGATVPSTLGKDPFKLEAKELRGQLSQGMMATGKELGINNDEAGLLVITADEVGEELARPGTPFSQLYGLSDMVIDIENKMFTHRPDCFGVLGVARELAGIQNEAFVSPDWYHHAPSFGTADELPLEVSNAAAELSPRTMLVAINNITIGPSPLWMQAGLTRLGVRPINNIVDITNYVMHLTGQPLHAFDYDKIKERCSGGVVLGARLASEGEDLTLLGKKQIKLTNQDLVIATDKQAVDLAGVMGGAETEVSEQTKAIILTCSSFDMYTIRRTIMRHGIFTDAATRYTKGQSPLQNDRVLAFAMRLILDYSGGKQASNVKDTLPQAPQLPAVSVSPEFINSRLGLSLSTETITTLLTNVEFVVTPRADQLAISVPFWRTDIAIPEDIVEEVGRLYGFDHLPLDLPTRTLKPAVTNPLLDLKSTIRRVLRAAGANEVLTYSFVHGDLLDKTGQNRDDAYQLANALSPDLQYYRLSLTPSLLDRVHPNLKAGYSEFALFEMNPVHAKGFVDKQTGLPLEDQRLAFVFAADAKLAQHAYAGPAYYQAKYYAANLLAELGITHLQFESASAHKPTAGISQAAIAPFETMRSSIIKTADGQFIGELGEYRTQVRKNLKLPPFVAGFELDLRQLLKLLSSDSPYVALPRYPKVEQDISLRLAEDLSYGKLFDFLQQNVVTPAKSAFWFAPLDIYQDEKDKTHKHVTLRFSIASYERTLTSEEVNGLLDKVAALAKSKLGAERL